MHTHAHAAGIAVVMTAHVLHCTITQALQSLLGYTARVRARGERGVGGHAVHAGCCALLHFFWLHWGGGRLNGWPHALAAGCPATRGPEAEPPPPAPAAHTPFQEVPKAWTKTAWDLNPLLHSCIRHHGRSPCGTVHVSTLQEVHGWLMVSGAVRVNSGPRNASVVALLAAGAAGPSPATTRSLVARATRTPARTSGVRAAQREAGAEAAWCTSHVTLNTHCQCGFCMSPPAGRC